MTARLRRAAQRVIDAMAEVMPSHSVPLALITEVASLAAAMPRTKRRPPNPSKVERRGKRLSKRAERRERMASIRETVMERAQGHCEVCATGRAEEAHHLIGGGLRRVKESVMTVVALCGDCHRAMHRGDLDVLESARLYAESCGMHDAVAALAKRIDKINEARAA